MTPRFDNIGLADPIDWTINPFENRSWLWLFHQLFFIKDLIAYDAEANSTDGFSYAIKALKSWWKAQEHEDLDTDITWHDHGSARRAETLLQLMSRVPEKDEKLKSYLVEILELHAYFLADDNIYNTGTNHGLDQSIALYKIAANFKDQVWHTKFAKLAVERIKFEVETAFAPDGGHRENSTQYHHFGIVQLLKVKALRDDWAGLGVPEINSVDKRLNRAVGLYPHLLGPGCTVHQIGDTVRQPIQDFIKGSRLPGNYPYYRYALTGGKRGRPPEKTGIALPESGWISLRNNWSNDAVHLLAHCGNFSDYHRHDDDGSFSLKAHGEDWVIDSGLYKYDETSAIRQYVRSAKAHSLSAPVDVTAIRKRRYNEQDSSISFFSLEPNNSVVETVSHMFSGFEMSRRFEFQVAADNSKTNILISDQGRPVHDDQIIKMKELSEKNQVTFTTRFIFPMDKKININHGASHVIVEGKQHRLKLKIESDFNFIRLISAIKGDSIDGWRSVEFGTIEPSQIIEISYIKAALSADYRITWMKIN